MVETGLGRTDLEALLDVVAGLAAVRPLADLRADTVAALPSLVSSDHPAWNEVDPETGEIAAAIPLEFEQSIGDRMPELTAVFAAHVDEHPVIADYRRTGNGRPQAISDFVSPEAFHATALYQDFYAVFGTEDQMSFVLPAPDVTIGITVDRPERSFKPRDPARSSTCFDRISSRPIAMPSPWRRRGLRSRRSTRCRRRAATA